MSQENVDLVRAVLPPADADIAALVRDDSLLDATIEALAPLLDPRFESVLSGKVVRPTPESRGSGSCGSTGSSHGRHTTPRPTN
jgi:hypothetical protein